MGTLNSIVTQLKTLVGAIQYSGSTAFVDVKSYASNNFEGYPSVTIVNAEVESTYDTQAQNLRTYNIYVYIYENLELLDDDAAWDRIRDLQDSVLDAIDRSLDLAATADFVRPTASQPFEGFSSTGGKLLIAPITVRAVVSIDIM